MNSQKEVIVVTGAAGFIGSQLCERILEETHYHVIGIDNFHPYYPKPLKLNNLQSLQQYRRFQFIDSCFSDEKTWFEISKNHVVQSVIHLAAFAGVRPSISNPVSYYENNVVYTIKLLEIMRQQQIENIIFTSSSSVYGGHKVTPFNEGQKIDCPASPYAASKKAGEDIIYNFCYLYGMKGIALRLFTVYGPRQRPDLAIRKFMVKIDKGDPIPVYGDGSSARDYTHVSDIVRGYILCLSQIQNFEQSRFETFNLGSGRTISLNEMIHQIEELLGKKAIIQRHERHPADLEVTYADISKARTLLGYDPQVSFQEGLFSLHKWLESNELAKNYFSSKSNLPSQQKAGLLSWLRF